jgi:hypothetical protein
LGDPIFRIHQDKPGSSLSHTSINNTAGKAANNATGKAAGGQQRIAALSA